MSETVTDRDALTRLAEAGLAVREVKHHRRDDESRIVTWSSPPDDAQRERAERILAGCSVHHAS
jgi:replicative superfamily II helicase